jgi:hypothetical protein
MQLGDTPWVRAARTYDRTLDLEEAPQIGRFCRCRNTALARSAELVGVSADTMRLRPSLTGLVKSSYLITIKCRARCARSSGTVHISEQPCTIHTLIELVLFKLALLRKLLRVARGVESSSLSSELSWS